MRKKKITFFNKLSEDYKKTKQPTDDFLSWLLLRKINTCGKIFFAITLWLLWLKFAFNLRFMVFFFEFIFICFIVYLLYSLMLKIWQWLK